MDSMRFEAPETVDAAVSLLAGASGETRVLAGEPIFWFNSVLI